MRSTVAERGRTDAVAGAGAAELRDEIARGALRAEELCEACIARTEASEDDIRAWAWFDAGFARQQAKALDAHRRTGHPVGPLHGLPVGVKDVIDTARIPTENGCPVDAGRVPSRDAWLVQRLRASGALVFGKTVSTELAFMHPSRTRNPRNLAHTPGGSSAGSAAAVAAGHVPLAIGTQTGGSVIRPAAFCGTVGFKPSFGRIPRTGVLTQSPSLDTIGVFARDVLGAALLAEALYGADPGDPATAPSAPPRLLEIARAAPPVPPFFAFLRPPGWEEAHAETRAALEEIAGRLGGRCFEVPLPAIFNDAPEMHRIVQTAELSRCFYGYERRGRGRLSEETLEAIDRGKRILARDYISALDRRPVYNAALEEILSRCDAILAPSAPGPAPHGFATTGDAVFNGLWTLCGTPAVTLPVFEASNGLPMGLQLIGRRDDDARLLRTANWLAGWIASLSEGETA